MSNNYPLTNSSTRFNIARDVNLQTGRNIEVNGPILFSKVVVFNSSQIVKRAVITNDYTVEASGDDHVLLVDTTSNTVTVTLPDPTNDTLVQGRMITIIDMGNATINNITIQTQQDDSSEVLISGELSIIISSNYNAVSLMAGPNHWYIW